MSFLVLLLPQNDINMVVNFSLTEITRSYVRKGILTYEKMRAYVVKYDFSSISPLPNFLFFFLSAP